MPGADLHLPAFAAVIAADMWPGSENARLIAGGVNALPALLADSEALAAVRTVAGLLPEATPERVVEHVADLRADNVRLVRERADAVLALAAIREALGLPAEATAEDVVEATRERVAFAAHEHREANQASAYAARLDAKYIQTHADLEEWREIARRLRDERDALAAAMAPDAAMRVHDQHCAQCSGPNDGCELGQDLEERCHRGGWEVPRV